MPSKMGDTTTAPQAAPEWAGECHTRAPTMPQAGKATPEGTSAPYWLNPHSLTAYCSASTSRQLCQGWGEPGTLHLCSGFTRYHTIASTQPKVLTQWKSYIKNYGRWYLQAHHLNLLALLFLTILSSSSRAIQKEKQYFCSARYDLTFSSTSESPSTEIKSIFSLLLLNFVHIKQWNCLKISGNWSSRKSVCS